MNTHKYTIGVDYGTESGRAVLVDWSRPACTATRACSLNTGPICHC
jgi:ribulose kinase